MRVTVKPESSGRAQVLPPEEAKLLERIWASATGRAFPVKGRVNRDDAALLARELLRTRLRREELVEPEAA